LNLFINVTAIEKFIFFLMKIKKTQTVSSISWLQNEHISIALV